MKAIKSVALGRSEIVSDISQPSAKGHAGFVLIKTKYVGINHCDYLFTDLDLIFQQDATIGSECCGEVVEVAEEGYERFKVGDVIAGCVFISCTEVLPDAGCLAEYALVKGDAQFSLDAMGKAVSPQQAAGMGVPLSTAFYGLYHCLQLPWPGQDTTATRKTILVYGGATSTGMVAIQLAKLSGLTVLTVCSRNNFDLMRSLGADSVFDYHDEAECIKQVREVANDNLELIFNCFGAGDSARLCGEMISAGGTYVSVAPVEVPQKEKSTLFHFVQGQMVLGEPFKFMGQVIPADQAIFKKWKEFIPLCEDLIRAGKIKLSPVSVISGLEGVAEAYEFLKNWNNHAQRIVCAME
ncbi:hypothetical protein F4778DRAFT_725375 [Xylariomycetidae sp. FL2044]|nr:hypothetical protein F4778DRAFT_725375 [Xylariomycetidae sp. FL2044]